MRIDKRGMVIFPERHPEGVGKSERCPQKTSWICIKKESLSDNQRAITTLGKGRLTTQP